MPPASELLAGWQINGAQFKSRPRKIMRNLFQIIRLSIADPSTSGQHCTLLMTKDSRPSCCLETVAPVWRIGSGIRPFRQPPAAVSPGQTVGFQNAWDFYKCTGPAIPVPAPRSLLRGTATHQPGTLAVEWPSRVLSERPAPVRFSQAEKSEEERGRPRPTRPRGNSGDAQSSALHCRADVARYPSPAGFTILAASTRPGEDDGDQDARKRDRVGRLSGLDGRPGRRIPVRQRRHRLRADDRGAREGPGARAAASQARHLPPREHRPAHGDRLLPRHRAAPAHHASRQRGHGQRDERALERIARTGAGARSPRAARPSTRTR